VADEPYGRIHAFEAGVGESEPDGVGDLVAVDVEGKGGTDERVQLARQRGEDPVVEKRGCLVVVVRSEGRRLLARRRIANRVPLIQDARSGSVCRICCHVPRRGSSERPPGELDHMKGVRADRRLGAERANGRHPSAM